LHWLHGKFETNWTVTVLIYLLCLNSYHTHTKILHFMEGLLSTISRCSVRPLSTWLFRILVVLSFKKAVWSERLVLWRMCFDNVEKIGMWLGITFLPIFTECMWSQNGNTISLSFQYCYKVILEVTLIIMWHLF